jgi:hypothetical protein
MAIRTIIMGHEHKRGLSSGGISKRSKRKVEATGG